MSDLWPWRCKFYSFNPNIWKGWRCHREKTKGGFCEHHQPKQDTGQ